MDLLETLTEHWEELSGAIMGLLAAVLAVKAVLKKIRKGPPPEALLVLIIAASTTQLAACGAAQPAKDVLECATPAPSELVAEVFELLLHDGGAESRKVSDRLMDTAWTLASRHGLNVLKCAVAEIVGGGALSGGPRVAAAPPDPMHSRAVDLFERLNE